MFIYVSEFMLFLSKVSLHPHVELTVEQIHMVFIGNTKAPEERTTDLIDIADDHRWEVDILKNRKEL